MNIKNIHLAYFSATFSTKRIVREIASQFQKPVIEYDITSDVLKDDVFGIWSRSSLLFEAKSWSFSISSALGLPSAILGNIECWAMTAAAESNLKPWDSIRSFSSMSVSSYALFP
mgnify:CR=1 FL=1